MRLLRLQLPFPQNMHLVGVRGGFVSPALAPDARGFWLAAFPASDLWRAFGSVRLPARASHGHGAATPITPPARPEPESARF